MWGALLADFRLVLLLLLLEADLPDLLLDFLPVDLDLGMRLNLFTGLGVDFTFDKRGTIVTASSALSCWTSSARATSDGARSVSTAYSCAVACLIY